MSNEHNLMWSEASRDVEFEERNLLLAKARVALAESWGFLSQASSTSEYRDRLALMDEQVSTTLSSVTGREDVHAEVLAAMESDFTKVLASRPKVAGGGEAWQQAQEGGHASQVEFALSMLGAPEDQIESLTQSFLAQWDGSGDAGESAQSWYESRTASRRKVASDDDAAMAAWALDDIGVPDGEIDALVAEFLGQWSGGWNGIWAGVQDWYRSRTASRSGRTSSLPASVSDHDATPESGAATAHDLCKTCGWPVEKKGDGWAHESKNPTEWTDKRKSASRKEPGGRGVQALRDCIAAGTHLKDKDSSGYCNVCEWSTTEDEFRAKEGNRKSASRKTSGLRSATPFETRRYMAGKHVPGALLRQGKVMVRQGSTRKVAYAPGFPGHITSENATVGQTVWVLGGGGNSSADAEVFSVSPGVVRVKQRSWNGTRDFEVFDTGWEDGGTYLMEPEDGVGTTATRKTASAPEFPGHVTSDNAVEGQSVGVYGGSAVSTSPAEVFSVAPGVVRVKQRRWDGTHDFEVLDSGWEDGGVFLMEEGHTGSRTANSVTQEWEEDAWGAINEQSKGRGSGREIECMYCNGTGKVGRRDCDRCGGKGMISLSRKAAAARRKTSSLLCGKCTDEAVNRWKTAPSGTQVSSTDPMGSPCTKCGERAFGLWPFESKFASRHTTKKPPTPTDLAARITVGKQDEAVLAAFTALRSMASRVGGVDGNAIVSHLLRVGSMDEGTRRQMKALLTPSKPRK